MAVMASPQPEPVTLDLKASVAVPEQDKVTVEKSETPHINGNSKPSDALHTEEPLTNGNAEKPSEPADTVKSSQNQQAFEANQDLPPQEPTKAASPKPVPEDSEMPDVNGTDKENAPTPETKPEASSVAESAETAELQPAATTPAPAETAEPVVESKSTEVTDSMEVDTTQPPDLSSSIENIESTQDTSAVSDAPVATTPKDINLEPNTLSQLDIGKTEEEAPVKSLEEDAPMADAPAPSSPTKVSRERDLDTDDEPAAKRARTDGTNDEAEDSLVVNTAGPSVNHDSESLGSSIPDDQNITSFQNRMLRQAIGGIKKTKNGGNFKQSVEKLWPALWADYLNKVQSPVDLSLFEQKLREDKYPNFGALKADVALLHVNALSFNGPMHTVTGAAAMVRDQLFAKFADIAKQAEPLKAERVQKVMPNRNPEPRAATQPRRQSVSKPASPKRKSPQPAPAAPATSSATAFAVPANGIPQIRRDSTRDDGDRPKRPIHPPKNRDPDYTTKNNRKKKLEPELRFCEQVHTELTKTKYESINQAFLYPVDPVALGIPSYFKTVKKPMDLDTIGRKIREGEYKGVKDFEKDIRQMVHNSEMFNGADHVVTRQGQQLEELAKEQLSKKDEWLAQHAPAAAPTAPSPTRSEDSSDEEEEVEEEGEDSNETIRNLQTKLQEERGKLDVLINAKKPDMTMVDIQQQMITLLQTKLVTEKTRLAEEKPKSKPKKKASKPKAKPSGGATSAASNKKAAGGSGGAAKKAGGGAKKAGGQKKRNMGALEKAVIAEGINELDGNLLSRAVDIIKKDTHQTENDSGEMELDIETLSNDALTKLYDLINKAHPTILKRVSQRSEFADHREPTPPPEKERKPSTSLAKGLPKTKKNKPMGKAEQERKIEQLRELKAQFQRQGSGSQEPVPGLGEEIDQGRASESEDSDSEEE